ncbi:MAG: hypothetical protein JOZ39_11110 [Chloroflexi bacterium]|nr:hypothetical protein [Chloroflexota bacterium]
MVDDAAAPVVLKPRPMWLMSWLILETAGAVLAFGFWVLLAITSPFMFDSGVTTGHVVEVSVVLGFGPVLVAGLTGAWVFFRARAPRLSAGFSAIPVGYFVLAAGFVAIIETH